ncbi:MAG: YgaP family membrane protein [Myxococcaceae bacterium]
MTIEGAVRVLAGSLVLLGLLLSQLVSPWWLLLDVFVGLNLIQSAFTGVCPAASIFRRLGIGKDARVVTTGTDVPL